MSAFGARATIIHTPLTMIFKLIGAAAILAVGALAAASLNSGERKKEEQISALLTLLRFFRAQIDCYSVPVGEIFRRCDKKTLETCGYNGVPPDFESFCRDILPRPDKETSELLASFSAELGASYREGQIKNCDYHIARLSALAEEGSRRAAQKRKKNTVLCLTAAALIVILLL